jgi:hypothetical protein
MHFLFPPCALFPVKISSEGERQKGLLARFETFEMNSHNNYKNILGKIYIESQGLWDNSFIFVVYLTTLSAAQTT